MSAERNWQLKNAPHYFANIFAAIAVLGILCGAMTITVDVLLRWVSGHAILALNEITTQLFAVAVAATLPAGAIRQANLKVDLLAGHFEPKLTRFLAAAGSGVLVLMFGLLAWNTFGLALKFQEQSRHTIILN